MRRLSLVDLDELWSELESVLDRTPDIDRWCSGLDWVLPVHAGFGAEAEPLVLASAEPAQPGFALLARYRTAENQVVVAGLEPLWGFASPLVGPNVALLAEQLAGELATRAWDRLMLPGMPAPAGPGSYLVEAAGPLQRLGQVGLRVGIVRQTADLSAGYEPWLARRSSRFRRNLHRAGRQALATGLSFVQLGPGCAMADEDDDVFDRILAIEARSWKGRQDSGLIAPEMRATYRAMVDRLRRRGRLRVIVARLGSDDVGYILGGVRAGVYRGLQISYTQEAASLSVGHLLQDQQLRILCQRGEAHTYDLGMDLDYKARWADRAVPTYILMVHR